MKIQEVKEFCYFCKQKLGLCDCEEQLQPLFDAVIKFGNDLYEILKPTFDAITEFAQVLVDNIEET